MLLENFLFPFAFGLIGFITPCSLGVNLVVLSYLSGRGRADRLGLATAFLGVRTVTLVAVGFSIALIGHALFEYQTSYNRFLGLFFLLLGLWVLLGKMKGVPRLGPSAPLLTSGGKAGVLAMGAGFGLSIPACDAPFVMAMLGRTLMVGDFLMGGISLLIFALGTTLPLFPLVLWNGASQWLRRLQEGGGAAPYAVGGALLFAGLLTLSPELMWALFTLPGAIF